MMTTPCPCSEARIILKEQAICSIASLEKRIVSCRLCPRLVRYREKIAWKKRASFQNWQYWGKPVPGFGDPRAGLLIVGLAPAAHGGNRTGRMFTGDGSADFLIPALWRAGFANRPRSERRNDGLTLRGCFMTAVARCAPPGNKPLPRELAKCRKYLLDELRLLRKIRAILVLGRIAMDGFIDALKASGHPMKRLPFRHGGEYELPGFSARLFASYHPSRQNTQTGRLTATMLDSVLRRTRKFLARRERTGK